MGYGRVWLRRLYINSRWRWGGGGGGAYKLTSEKKKEKEEEEKRKKELTRRKSKRVETRREREFGTLFRIESLCLRSVLAKLYIHVINMIAN